MPIYRKLSLAFTLLFFSLLSRAQITANFSASTTGGCAALVVFFHNSTTGGTPTTYVWDLGNGTVITNPASTPDAAGTFLLPGTYTVTLKAVNGSTVVSQKTMTITVYPKPNVRFNAASTTICAGGAVTFSNTSDGGAGVSGTLIYNWNFGDGGSNSNQTPTHTYNVPGDYNITLQVINSHGCDSLLTIPAYIHVLPPPAINFSLNAATFCTTPAHLAITDLTTGAGGNTYAWDFGDGNTSTSQNPTHDYGRSGSFNVSVTVTDKNGCKSTVTHFNAITIDSIRANFSIPASACAGSAISFLNTSNNAFSLNAAWDFGDGVTSPFINTTHKYNSPGTYKVKLTVSGGVCTDSLIKFITINPNPVPTITGNPTLPCPAPATVNFQATSSTPGATFTWYFPDDGSVITGGSPTHTFNANAYDTIIVVVKDGNGCVDTTQYIQHIDELHLAIAKAKRGLCEGQAQLFSLAPQTITPNLSYPGVAYPSSIASAVVDYGDGSPTGSITGANFSHIYNLYGHHVATITATLANGCTVTDTFGFDVGTPPTVLLSVTPTHICVRGFITFVVSATGAGPLTYSYNFGDGYGSVPILNDSFEVHRYLSPGIYQGPMGPNPPWLDSVTVYNSGCPTTVAGPVLIVDSPRAKLSYLTSCDTPALVKFTDSSIGETSRIWYFGDGTTDTSSVAPAHTYATLGPHTVMLVAHSSRSGCNDTATVNLVLVQLQPSFVADKTVICTGGIVNFTGSVAGGTSLGYYWYIDGTIPFRTNPGLTHTDTFYTPGKHTIEFKVQDQYSCFTSIVRSLYITVAKPYVNTSSKPEVGCSPFNATITDSTTDSGNIPIVSRTWKFGDSTAASTGNQTTISHIFRRPGFYNVTLIATDNNGCTDSTTFPGLVAVDKPTARFSVINQNVCKNTQIGFLNNSGGNVPPFNLAYSYWYFGDGDSVTTMASTSTAHTYHQNGSYDVTLIVIDSFGCLDTVHKPAYMSVTSPTAAFTETDSVGICPGLKDSFINASSAGAYAWYFGDGNTSTLNNPTNIFATYGLYKVVLVVTDANGCTDTAINHVKLYGYSGTFTDDATAPGCAPFTVTFTANVSNVPSIIFDYTDGNIDSGNATVRTYTYTKPGRYLPKVILGKDGCQSSSTATDTIFVDGVKAMIITSPLCVYDTVQFKDSSYSYLADKYHITKWFWLFNDGVRSTSQNTYHYYSTGGFYSVIHVATDVNGCTDTVTDNFNVYDLPLITTVKDTVICVGDAATLTAIGGVSYSWSPPGSVACSNCQTTNASPAVKTLYTVTGTDMHGCTNKDTVTVNLKTQTTSYPSHGGAICPGDSIVLVDSGAQQYSWSPPDGLSHTDISNPVARPLSSITYTIIAREGSCIPNTDHITVIVYPKPVVKATGSTTIIAGNTAQLQATGTNVVKFAWSPAGTLNCDSCSDPNARPDSTTVYTAYGFSSLGCEDSDKVRINVLCDNSQVFIPNTFTPNGDGQNDLFFPRGVGLSSVLSFRIYDRWGVIVFERTNFQLNDEKSGWDGTFNGALPRPDVYVYVLNAVCSSGEPISWKGDVTVIR